MKLRTAGPAWLFCPADRPERFAKAAAAADVVILDLEDGVAEAQKPAARQALLDTPLDPSEPSCASTRAIPMNKPATWRPWRVLPIRR